MRAEGHCAKYGVWQDPPTRLPHGAVYVSWGCNTSSFIENSGGQSSASFSVSLELGSFTQSNSVSWYLDALPLYSECSRSVWKHPKAGWLKAELRQLVKNLGMKARCQLSRLVKPKRGAKRAPFDRGIS